MTTKIDVTFAQNNSFMLGMKHEKGRNLKGPFRHSMIQNRKINQRAWTSMNKHDIYSKQNHDKISYSSSIKLSFSWKINLDIAYNKNMLNAKHVMNKRIYSRSKINSQNSNRNSFVKSNVMFQNNPEYFMRVSKNWSRK